MDIFEEYKTYLTKEKSMSDNSSQAYLRDIKKLKIYCDDNKIVAPQLLTINDINNYILFIEKNGSSVSTVNRTVSSLKSFYKFLYNNQIIENNIADSLKQKVNKASEPNILDRDDVLKLLTAPNGDSLKEKRDRVMLEVLYATGMKVSELVSLTVENINLQLNFIKIETKKHERTVPIYSDAAKHLNDYIKLYRPLICSSETKFLFTNMNGREMTRQGLWKIINAYAQKSGINKNITPHTLRHSFATHLLENGANINDIKEMLGHSDISSTMVYSNMLKNKFTKEYVKYHPLANNK